MNICESLCWLPWNQEAVVVQKPHCVWKNPFCASLCKAPAVEKPWEMREALRIIAGSRGQP